MMREQFYCAVPGCSRLSKAQGMCLSHVRQQNEEQMGSNELQGHQSQYPSFSSSILAAPPSARSSPLPTASSAESPKADTMISYAATADAPRSCPYTWPPPSLHLDQTLHHWPRSLSPFNPLDPPALRPKVYASVSPPSQLFVQPPSCLPPPPPSSSAYSYFGPWGRKEERPNAGQRCDSGDEALEAEHKGVRNQNVVNDAYVELFCLQKKDWGEDISSTSSRPASSLAVIDPSPDPSAIKVDNLPASASVSSLEAESSRTRSEESLLSGLSAESTPQPSTRSLYQRSRGSSRLHWRCLTGEGAVVKLPVASRGSPDIEKRRLAGREEVAPQDTTVEKAIANRGNKRVKKRSLNSTPSSALTTAVEGIISTRGAKGISEGKSSFFSESECTPAKSTHTASTSNRTQLGKSKTAEAEVTESSSTGALHLTSSSLSSVSSVQSLEEPAGQRSESDFPPFDRHGRPRKPTKWPRRKKCSVESCPNISKTRGVCKRHGGGERCGVEGCPKSAKAEGLCVRHGGGHCMVEGCTTGARPGGLCRLHGRAQGGSLKRKPEEKGT